MKTIAITRKQLYDLVWAEPMRRLAACYGISDVALAKTCRKHDIPRPPRGYWAKIAAGQAPRQTKLPNPGDDSKITLRDPEECRLSPSSLADRKATAEEEQQPKITVAAHGTLDPKSDFARWLTWAVQQADRLDPLTESPPSILDEPMPEEPKPRYSWE